MGVTYKHYSNKNWWLPPWVSPEAMLDHNSVDLFHIFYTKPSFCHMTKNICHTKSPELFLWSPSLEACSISNLLLYKTNEADKLRRSVLHISNTSEIQIWDVSKNFQVPPFQQCKGMPTDCFCDPNFCVIYTVNHLLFWPYSGFIFHFPTQMPVVVDKYGSIAPLLKICSLCYSQVRHRNHVATECSRAVYCFRKKTKQHSKNNNPKTRDELSVESVPQSNPNHNL